MSVYKCLLLVKACTYKHLGLSPLQFGLSLKQFTLILNPKVKIIANKHFKVETTCLKTNACRRVLRGKSTLNKEEGAACCLI